VKFKTKPTEIIAWRRGDQQNMSEKIEFWMPIHASMRFKIKKPDDWDKMDRELKADYFFDNAIHSGSICYHCANDLETDYEVTDAAHESILDQLDV